MNNDGSAINIDKDDEAHFSSDLGFILTAAGSAIGLANIWKFPYMAYAYGGLTLILPYLFFMVFLAIPLFIAETAIGASAQAGPSTAFFLLGNRPRISRFFGRMTVLTGFLISSFYSVVTGWILGYAIESIFTGFQAPTCLHAQSLWHEKLHNPLWNVGYHTIFALSCLFILQKGVKQGLEKLSRIGMPIFFICVAILCAWTSTLDGFSKALTYITSFQPIKDGSELLILVAIGHAFFTLSVGQGTLVTYGSYMKKTSTIFSSTLIIALADTLISLLSTLILLSTVFSDPSAGSELTSGPSLLFETLPTFFTHMHGGRFIAPLFFLLVFLAAITSQLSALEPMIHFLEREKNKTRKKATTLVVALSWLIGVLAAISISIPGSISLNGESLFGFLSFTTTSLMLPLGALAASIIFIQAYRAKKLIDETNRPLFHSLPRWVRSYLLWSLKLAPISITFVFLSVTGIFTLLFS